MDIFGYSTISASIGGDNYSRDYNLGTKNNREVNFIQNGKKRIKLNTSGGIDFETTPTIGGIDVLETKLTKGGDSDGGDLVMGTLDDNHVVIKQNGFDQVGIGNNQLDVCVCQSTPFTWGEYTTTNGKVLLDEDGVAGRLSFSSDYNFDVWVYTDITFNPAANDYDFSFTFARGPASTNTSNDQTSRNSWFGFTPNVVTGGANIPGTIFNTPVVGTFYQLTQQDGDGVNIDIVHGNTTNSSGQQIPVPFSSLLEFKIRDQVGTWYLNGVQQETGIVMDQTAYYFSFLNYNLGDTLFDVVCNWAIPGSQLQINSDSIKPKVPLVVRDNYSNSLSILDESGNSYLNVDSKNLTLELKQPVALSDVVRFSDQTTPSNPSDGQGLLYKKTGDDGLFWRPDSTGGEVDLTLGVPDGTKLTKGGDTDGTNLTLGTNDDFNVIIERNNIPRAAFLSTATIFDVPDASVNAFEIGDDELQVVVDTVDNRLIAKKDFQINGDFRYTKGFGEAYVNQSTQGVTTTAATWHDIEFEDSVAGVIDTPYSVGLTPIIWDIVGGVMATGPGTRRTVRMLYTGARSRVFHCGVSFSFKGDTNNRTYHFAAWKWDDSVSSLTIIPASEQKIGYTGGASQWRSSACHFMLTMDTNDYWVFKLEEVGGSGSIVTIEDANYFALGLPNVI